MAFTLNNRHQCPKLKLHPLNTTSPFSPLLALVSVILLFVSMNLSCTSYKWNCINNVCHFVHISLQICIAAP